MNIITHKTNPIKAEGTTHIHALKTYVQVFAGLKKGRKQQVGAADTRWVEGRIKW